MHLCLPGLWQTSVPLGTVSRRLVPGAGMQTSFSKFDNESTMAAGWELTVSCKERRMRSKVAINGTLETIQMERRQYRVSRTRSYTCVTEDLALDDDITASKCFGLRLHINTYYCPDYYYYYYYYYY